MPKRASSANALGRVGTTGWVLPASIGFPRFQPGSFHDCVFKPRLEILPPAQQQLWPELKSASALSGPAFQPSESLKAMVYFADGDLWTLTAHEKNTLVTAVSAVRELPAVSIIARRLAATRRVNDLS